MRVDNPNPRHVSRMTRDTLALVLAGGRGSRLHELTDWRAKPALYFGGKYRIIDFPLSNCINSGIRRIGVLTQYKAHSLVRHLVRGWGFFKNELGEFVDVLPASQRHSEAWYQGTADAIYQNLDIIRAVRPKYVLVLSGDHVYKMDYGLMLSRACLRVCLRPPQRLVSSWSRRPARQPQQVYLVRRFISLMVSPSGAKTDLPTPSRWQKNSLSLAETEKAGAKLAR